MMHDMSIKGTSCGETYSRYWVVKILGTIYLVGKYLVGGHPMGKSLVAGKWLGKSLECGYWMKYVTMCGEMSGGFVVWKSNV